MNQSGLFFVENLKAASNPKVVIIKSTMAYKSRLVDMIDKYCIIDPKPLYVLMYSGKLVPISTHGDMLDLYEGKYYERVKAKL